MVLAYLASYLSGYYKPIELTYNAMEYAYAIDSLYYVLSLLLIAAGALRVTSWLGKVAIAIGAALLAMTPVLLGDKHFYGGVTPLCGDLAIHLLIQTSLAFCARGGAPERGFTSLRQMSRWGDTPLFPPPRGRSH